MPSFAHTPGVAERVEVLGHYEDAPGTTDSASQGTVTAKLIENRPVLRPAEVLEFVPGLVITQHSGDGKANQYYLRGFNLDHGTDFATWIDGMPANMPTHAHGQGYSDLNFLIPELVRRVDYFKGPYFASEGDFSSAGAARIGLANRLPRDIGELSVGEHGYRRGLLAADGAAGDGIVLGALEAMQNDGPWKSPENLRKWNGMLRYSQTSDALRWSVTAMGYEARWNATDQVPQRAVNAGTIDRFGTVDPTDGGSTARYSLSFDLSRVGDTDSFEVNAYAIRSRLDLFSNFTYFLDDPVRGDQFEQSERRNVIGGRAAWHRASAWSGIAFDSTLGVQARRDRIDPVGLYRTEARERTGTTSEDRVTESSGSAYIESTARWTEKFRTLAGIRYDAYRFDVGNDAGNSGRASDHIVSPKLSAAFGPWDGVEAFLNWGRGFHSNDARGIVAPNPVTPLVRSTGMETGFRVRPVAGLQSAVAVWRLDLDSELVFVGDAGTTEASRPSRRQGVEWTNHYVVNPHWLVDLDLAFSRARFRDDDAAGNYIPGALETVASLGVAAVDLGPWSGSLQMRYFGPRALIEDNSVRSKATTLANGRLAYRITKDMKVVLDGFNLFDRKASDIDYCYASRLRGEPAAGVADIHFHPVEPRAFRIGLSVRF